VAVQDVTAVGAAGFGGAVGVEDELPAAAVDADVVVELALCRPGDYADWLHAIAGHGVEGAHAHRHNPGERAVMSSAVDRVSLTARTASARADAFGDPVPRMRGCPQAHAGLSEIMPTRMSPAGR